MEGLGRQCGFKHLLLDIHVVERSLDERYNFLQVLKLFYSRDAVLCDERIPLAHGLVDAQFSLHDREIGVSVDLITRGDDSLVESKKGYRNERRIKLELSV